MPVKTKAKDHSVYMRQITHNHLTHIHHVHQPMSDWKKVLIGLGVMLVVAIIILGFWFEA